MGKRTIFTPKIYIPNPGDNTYELTAAILHTMTNDERLVVNGRFSGYFSLNEGGYYNVGLGIPAAFGHLLYTDPGICDRFWDTTTQRGVWNGVLNFFETEGVDYYYFNAVQYPMVKTNILYIRPINEFDYQDAGFSFQTIAETLYPEVS